MASVWAIQYHFVPLQPSIRIRVTKHGIPSSVVQFTYGNRLNTKRKFLCRAINASMGPSEELPQPTVDQAVKTDNDDAVTKKFHRIINSLPPSVAFLTKRHAGINFAIGFCIAIACFVVAVRVYVWRKAMYSHPGSVADLVRRGQLRSDRRGISRPLNYEDPFNNPLVKVDKGNSTVEICGKVYRLAPVTLTKEEQAIHQKRRSRAYQWKRPTIFLKDGDSIPPDVDPDAVRWIPANHPFATTASDIDENLAQNNVYQKHGVPFRIKAEHEALQKKLEALQNEQKLNKLVIDSSNAKDFERSFKLNSKSWETVEQSNFDNQEANSKPRKPDHAPNSFGSSSSSEKERA
ncbi:hypothetical protein CFOL_v3_09358 [Cephalotus follicularis]|uniref:Protein MULTIPLE CHLOROPLAST DIVISION SITE 1 n=1 Tax=Cephalotus follicularis TaxID=3775 RepID=A0A1Q3BDC9_CEPFO|nr:hypothetical protein CFOL_v3_09358 [Cephalotus follicularis]